MADVLPATGSPVDGDTGDGDAADGLTPVARRDLVPTPRLRSSSSTALPMPGEEARPRAGASVRTAPDRGGQGRPSAGGLRRVVRAADPRSIAGPKLPVIVLGLAAGIPVLETNVLGVLLPEIQATFGLNISAVTAIGSLATAFSFLLGIPIGYLVDRVKRVRLVQLSTLAAGLSLIGTGGAGSVGAMVAARGAGGGADAFGRPSHAPLLADYYPVRSRARVLAFSAQITALVGLGAAPAAGRLSDAFGWRNALEVMAVFALVVFALTLFLREPKRGYWDRLELGASEEVAAKEQRPVSFAEGIRAAMGVATVRRLCYAIPFLIFGYQGLGILFNLYFAQVFGLTATARGNITTIGGVAGIAGLLVGGPVADRLLADRPSRVMTIFGGLLATAAAFVMPLAFVPAAWMAIAVLVPVFFVLSMILPVVLTLLTMVVPARVRGLGVQLIALPSILGLILIALMGGVADHIGVRHAMLACLPILVLGAVIVMSAAGGVARDIRSALAASMADEEAERARRAGRAKMVICRDVDVDYDGVQVLFNVDFDVEDGELIALLGTNGAGKSTLLRAIAGVQQAAAGAIFLDGDDITHAPPHENAARGIVMMPGGAATFPALTVEENLRAAAWMQRADAAAVTGRIEQVLDFFPVLRDRLQQPAGNLSGGEQQMVGLGQAFLMHPRLLMIDELSLGLSPAVVEQLLDTLRRIHAEGTTIILVEQSINVALTIAERAVFMEKGEIRFDGPTDALLARPDLVRSVFMGGGVAGGSSLRRPAAGESTTTLLSVRDVAVSFGGVQALRGAEVDVAPGEVVGVIGPNGAGKTTLFDVVSGFVIPDRGTVTLETTDLQGLSPDGRARLGLARSFQNARLFPSLTVRENVAVALERRAVKNPLHGAVWSPKVRRSEARLYRRVDGLLELLGLTPHADKFVSELSTGTRRAVDVAIIMAAEPKLLLLDEPSSGLAQAETEDLGPVILRVAREAGCGILVIEHDLPLITSISDRLVAMELGATITTGSPADVVADPRVVASYLAASTDVVNRSGSRMNRVAAALGDATGAAADER